MSLQPRPHRHCNRLVKRVILLVVLCLALKVHTTTPLISQVAKFQVPLAQSPRSIAGHRCRLAMLLLQAGNRRQLSVKDRRAGSLSRLSRSWRKSLPQIHILAIGSTTSLLIKPILKSKRSVPGSTIHEPGRRAMVCTRPSLCQTRFTHTYRPWCRQPARTSG